MDADHAIRELDRAIAEHPDVTVRIAWTAVRPLARRQKRISETLLSVSYIAQRAILVRDAIDVFLPALPTVLHARVAQARMYVIEILNAVSTGARDSDEPPPT